MKKLSLVFFLSLILTSCFEVPHAQVKQSAEIVDMDIGVQIDTHNILKDVIRISKLEQKLVDSGLVNIRDVDSTIQVDLRYATKNNFLDIILYDSLSACYLQNDVAAKVALAQFLLKSEHNSYSLKIFDGVRPSSVQLQMWNMLDMPVSEKTKYVSNPKNGSVHNYGAAVDLTIVDDLGRELDMATDYDYFGELAYPRLEQKLFKEGKLTQKQLDNRILLRRIMKEAGFVHITTEWWHFNACSRQKAKELYSIIE